MTEILPSRGVRGYAGAVLAGFISAALFGFAFLHSDSLLIMLAYLAAIPLFVVGLGAGAICAAVASTLGVGLMCYTGQLNLALFYLGCYALPAAVLCMLALRHSEANGKTEWYPEGNVLIAATLYPCMAFVAAYVSTMGQGGLLARTKSALAQVIEPMKNQVDSDLFAQVSSAMDTVARMLPATLGCCWIIVMLLSLWAAQVTLQQQGWNLRAGFDIKKITLPRWVIIPVAIAALIGFAPDPYGYLGTNLAVMLSLAYFLAGLGVLHAWTATIKGGVWILVAFYVLLMVPLPITIIPTTVFALLLAVADQWIDLRRRFAGKKQGG